MTWLTWMDQESRDFMTKLAKEEGEPLEDVLTCIVCPYIEGWEQQGCAPSSAEYVPLDLEAEILERRNHDLPNPDGTTHTVELVKIRVTVPPEKRRDYEGVPNPEGAGKVRVVSYPEDLTKAVRQASDMLDFGLVRTKHFCDGSTFEELTPHQVDAFEADGWVLSYDAKPEVPDPPTHTKSREVVGWVTPWMLKEKSDADTD